MVKPQSLAWSEAQPVLFRFSIQKKSESQEVWNPDFEEKQPIAKLLGTHERVLHRGRWIPGFFDGPRTYPAVKIEHRASLVVGTGGTGATEWLLAHHGAGWLVVDVEITRSLR